MVAGLRDGQCALAVDLPRKTEHDFRSAENYTFPALKNIVGDKNKKKSS